MREIRMLPIAEYEKTVKLNGVEIPCYTKKELDDKYPNDDWTLIGETKKKNKKRIRAELFLSDVKSLNELNLDDEGNEIPFEVCGVGQHSKILYKRAGYVPVNSGEDTYVALLKFRAAFIFWLLGLLLLLGLIAGLIFWHFHNPGDDTPTYDPLPPVDTNATPVEGDDTVQNTDGGAFISMEYRLKAKLSLSTGNIEIYFKNPKKSNQNAVLSLYVVSDDSETMIAESGMIQTGYELRSLQFMSDRVEISEGRYKGKFKLTYYDPETGQKSFVQPEIVDVVITVTE